MYLSFVENLYLSYVFQLFLNFCYCLILIIPLYLHVFKTAVPIILTITLTFIAGGFLMIFFKNEFFGVIYIIIYVGAISILFLFVIMLLNLRVLLNQVSTYMLCSFLLSYFFGIMMFFWTASAELFSIYNPVDTLFDQSLFFSFSFFTVYAFYIVFAGLLLFVTMLGVVLLLNDFFFLTTQRFIENFSGEEQERLFYRDPVTLLTTSNSLNSRRYLKTKE